jgi:hypothetical protein
LIDGREHNFELQQYAVTACFNAESSLDPKFLSIADQSLPMTCCIRYMSYVRDMSCAEYGDIVGEKVNATVG